jgi:hypothetical protein
MFEFLVILALAVCVFVLFFISAQLSTIQKILLEQRDELGAIRKSG